MVLVPVWALIGLVFMATPTLILGIALALEQAGLLERLQRWFVERENEKRRGK